MKRFVRRKERMAPRRELGEKTVESLRGSVEQVGDVVAPTGKKWEAESSHLTPAVEVHKQV